MEAELADELSPTSEPQLLMPAQLDATEPRSEATAIEEASQASAASADDAGTIAAATATHAASADDAGPASREAPDRGVDSATDLFRALRIERSPGGHLRIEAPPEAAESLLALFEGMAKLLGSAMRG